MDSVSSKTSVVSPRSDSLRDQLIAFHSTFRGLHGQSTRFDLQNCDWMRPLSLTTMCAYLREYGGDYIPSRKAGVQDYLKGIHFPVGISKASEVNVDALNAPIGMLSADDVKAREVLESKFYEIVKRLTGNVVGADNAILYPLSELIGNIFEHSKKPYGWIFAQHYPKKKLLEICIADTGRGVVQSYIDELQRPMSDSEAISEALTGLSAKKKEGGRGWGLGTSQRVVCEALRGQFLFLTGPAVYFNAGGHPIIAQLPDFSWRGVVIAYQIPYPQGPIDISTYIE